MSNQLQKHRGTKQLSSSPHTARGSIKDDSRYAFKNAGPAVQENGKNLVGKAINLQASDQKMSAKTVTQGGQDKLETNVCTSLKGTCSEASISGITIAAGQGPSYTQSKINKYVCQSILCWSKTRPESDSHGLVTR